MRKLRKGGLMTFKGGGFIGNDKMTEEETKGGSLLPPSVTNDQNPIDQNADNFPIPPSVTRSFQWELTESRGNQENGILLPPWLCSSCD